MITRNASHCRRIARRPTRVHVISGIIFIYM